MAKFIVILSLFLSVTQAAYMEELKWPKGETFLTFLDKNHLPSSIYYSLDKE